MSVYTVSSSKSSDSIFPKVRPSLDLDFANSKTLDPRITFTRSSGGSYVGADGLIKYAGVNEPRFDHDPVTGESLGLLIEEQRTNSIRNNTMVGAVAGTPGTLPTNWFVSTSLTGLAHQVVAVGQDAGISYIDFRVSGTPSGSGAYSLITEAGNVIAAAQNQVWTSSFYVSIVGGSTSAISLTSLAIEERNSSNVFLTQGAIPISISGSITRYRYSRTLVNSSTAFTRSTLQLNLSGAAIDITLRIGMPQLEQGAFATSVIPTSTAARTRQPDVARITGANFSSWYNQAEGTVFVDVLRSYSRNFPAFPNIFNFTDGTANNLFAMYGIINSQFVTNFSVYSGGVSQTNFVQVATNVPDPNRLAQALAVNSSMLAANGALTLQDSSVAMPVGINRVSIGSDGASLAQWGGTIRRLTYWPKRLSNSQLQALTR